MFNWLMKRKIKKLIKTRKELRDEFRKYLGVDLGSDCWWYFKQKQITCEEKIYSINKKLKSLGHKEQVWDYTYLDKKEENNG